MKYKIFTLFAALMFLLSLMIAVKAYPLDNTQYPLIIQDPTITSKNNINIQLYNPAISDFDYYSLNHYDLFVEKSTTRKQFSHTALKELTAIGKLKSSTADKFTLTSEKELKCDIPITIEMFLDNGVLIASWTGIPKCTIQKPRPTGLIKTTNSTAEFDNNLLKITWELLDYNPTTQKVLIKKTISRQNPTTNWYDINNCPDLSNGQCKTTIENMYTTTKYIHITLKDHREKTKVTLTKEKPEIKKTILTITTKDKTQIKPVKKLEVTTDLTNDTKNLETNKDQFLIVYPKENSKTTKVCISGCLKYQTCYQEKSRTTYLDNYVYCKSNSWLVQKEQSATCNTDYECETNYCKNNKCTIKTKEIQKKFIITRFLEWIDSLI